MQRQNFSMNAQGWVPQASYCASPNFDQRPSTSDISLLIIHNISLPPKSFGGGHVQPFFCNQLDASVHPYFGEIAQLRVSSHLFIERHGTVTQFVSLFDRAWHAGVSQFKGRSACNDFAIGIELEGADDIPYEPAQYQRLIELSCLICQQFPKITLDRIVGHSDVAPTRKTDPGEAFDWAYFKRGLARMMECGNLS